MELIPIWQVNLWTQKRDQGIPMSCLREKRSVTLPFTMAIETVIEYYGISQEELVFLNPNLFKRGFNFKNLKAGTIIWVPGKALNVSYSEYGLTWTANKFAKSLYYENAYLKQTDKGPRFEGNLKKRRNVYVEDFVPRNHLINGRLDYEAQKAEYLWSNKALRLLYGSEYQNVHAKDGSLSETLGHNRTEKLAA